MTHLKYHFNNIAQPSLKLVAINPVLKDLSV